MPTISNLPAATQVNGPDLLPIVQSTITKKATFSEVLTYVNTGLVITESQVTGLTASLAARLLIADNLSDLTDPAAARINLGLPALTNGQLWIGSTGVAPLAANITAGTNITITNAGGSITIAASGAGGFSWNHVTGTSQAMLSNNGYIADNVGLVTLSLPTSSSIGDEISIVGFGSGGWAIAQASGQIVHVGSVASTSGAGGSIASTDRYDSLYLVCVVANTTWIASVAPQGILTIV